MNVFMLTSVPMVPPWDQGDKNLAYALTTALPHIRFRVLTAQGSPPPPGDNLDLEPRYLSGKPSLVQKAHIFAWLYSHHRRFSINGAATSVSTERHLSTSSHSPELYHLIYRPYRLSSWMMSILPALRRTPTIHTIPATADGHPLERRLFFARQNVVLSNYGLRMLRRLGLKNVLHIPPGISIDDWVSLAEQSDLLKEQLGFGGHPVLLFPGHYGPGQGSEIMLEALPEILAQIPEARFIFACRLRSNADHERDQAARQKIRESGFSHAVRFYNTVADMRQLIGASDGVLLPLQTMRAKVDIPTTLLEALAAEKPIIISDIPPMNELVQKDVPAGEQVGFAVPPADSRALARAAVTLLKYPDLRAQMGACGQELVRSTYDIRNIAKEYEHLYQEMASCKQSDKLTRRS